MKQFVLPVLLPVVSFISIKIFAPEMESSGMILLIIIAILAGTILNSVLFKKEDNEEQAG
jgi:uncharacterized membrane protein YraQ (UPF0718 family)